MAIGEYDIMEEYYDTLEKDSVKTLTEKEIIGEKEIVKLHQAIYIIKNDFIHGQEASLNHEDPRLENILLTKPITIFDPNLKLEHPLIDMAAVQFHIFLDKNLIGDKKILVKKLQQWYEEITKKKIDQNIFNACLVIRIISKLVVLSQYTKQQEILKKALEILEKIQFTTTE